MIRRCAACLSVLLWTTAIIADGPGDNLADKVRPVPPPGIEVSAADRAELEAGVAQLGKQIAVLSEALKDKPALAELLSDVEVYHKAVRYALAYNEFYNPGEIEVARALLKQSAERAAALAEGKSPWTSATGLVVRGYRSKIDGSVQPYGLVIPPDYSSSSTARSRLDFWCHGRDETLTELNFINQRQQSSGDFTPPGAIVLHLYGRYCNANKFAGEIDMLEALAHVQKHYRIDEDRLVMRGFSMGGAACWQFAVHYPGLFAAAAPGAGFSETADFLKVFQNETVQPTWYERKLWHLYDATDYAVNLFNCPTVAYSGENDRQKQAADMMAKALAAEHMELTHIIGPKTEHSYHPEAKAEIIRRIDAIVDQGGKPVPPRRVRFTTWTLRYNQSHWVTVDALDEHWTRARVDATLAGPADFKVTTENVAGLTLSLPVGHGLADQSQQASVEVDGQKLAAPAPQADRPWSVHFRKTGDQWKVVDAVDDGQLRKVHGLQGPIDDAFMDSFIMVRPTGKPLNEKVGAWVAAEQAHAIDHWRRQFRGDARVKNDDGLTDADIADSNLVLWGDVSSNKILARIADKLPLGWNADRVTVGDQSYSSAQHVPVLINLNPLNAKRYVVLNSGFTFREYDYLNNARQVPKLPDFAVVDVSVPVTPRGPGGIVQAGFFGENWELLPVTKR